MKKILILNLLLLLAICCKKETYSSRLLNCAVEYLSFTDEYRFLVTSFHYPPNDPYKNKFTYSYQSDKIAKVVGGFQQIPCGSNLCDLIFSTAVHDSIIYRSDSVFVFTYPGVTYFLNDNPGSPSIYIYNSNGRFQKLYRRDGFEVNYEYSVNQITEKDKNGSIIRNLYFENNNLIRIEKLDYYGQETVQHKREILCQDYDNYPNPYMNTHYIVGAYIRAFSENNCKTIIFNEYNLVDGNLALTSAQTISIPFDYNKDHYPLFGDYK